MDIDGFNMKKYKFCSNVWKINLIVSFMNFVIV